MRKTILYASIGLSTLLAPLGSEAQLVNTGLPDGGMGASSRPGAFQIQTETADDFILSGDAIIDNATFYGLLPSGASLAGIGQVGVEIYRVFPKDSTDPPDARVPTRVNSPSDVAFDSRDDTAGNLMFSVSLINPGFTVANTVLNGIHPMPNQTTGGEGPATGQEVLFHVTFTTPFLLPADHYFFVPQVSLAFGDFYWLSSAKPIAPPGQPFTPDLEAWIRNADLNPDWLRIGTDIVGDATGGFNMSFTLDGTLVPEPSSILLVLGGFGIVGGRRFRPQHR